jgi:hypothetical protein
MSVLLPSKPIGLNLGGNSGGGTTVNTTINRLVVDDTGIFLLDDNTDKTSIILKTNNKSAIYINDTQRIGINKDSSITSRLEINDPIGDCIKLIYNNDKYSKIRVTQLGTLQLEPYENQYLNIQTSFSNNSGIKINGSLVESTAFELNYNKVLERGNAEADKAVILNSDKAIYGITTLSADHIIANKSLNLNMNSPFYAFTIQNTTGRCLKLKNDEFFTTFDITEEGIFTIYNDNNTIEILSNSNSGIIFPLQLTTENNLINTGVGIKFNTYNDINIKRNMSSIETIITNNENNNENSIIKFNNMNNGNLLNTVTIRNDGYIICNTLMELSDKRKKKIINESNSDDSLEKINSIKTYDFIYKDDQKKIIHKGIMAQELHEIIPSAVDINSIHGEYTVSNKELIGYLIDCVKSLYQSIAELQNIRS